MAAALTVTLPAMTNRTLLRTSVAALAVAAVAAPTAMGAGVQQANQARCSSASKGFVVGDSVVDAINYLNPGPLKAAVGGGDVSGHVNRQFNDGVGVVKQELAQNPKPCAVVISLGTNGPVTPSQWTGLMGLLSKVPRVVVVNTYTKNYRSEQPWMNQINGDIAKLPAKYRNVRVANWAALAPSLSSTELPDGVHPDTKKAAIRRPLVGCW